jgi:hypothetical protein
VETGFPKKIMLKQGVEGGYGSIPGEAAPGFGNSGGEIV